MNVAIGQGDVLATPLQMAVAYAGLATGTVWEPRVVSAIADFTGTIVDDVEPVGTEIDLPEGFLADFRSDMQRVTNAGTAEGAFSVMAQPWLTGGKTGTADVDPLTKLPHSWFVGVVPVDAPQYVVAVVVEEGGAGSAVAAPVARAVMQHLIGEDVDPVIEGGKLGDPLPWDSSEIPEPGDPFLGDLPDTLEASP